MKTLSVSIENLCVPCHCGCRHCLLSSFHKATGIDFHRGLAFAERFYDWLKENRPEMGGTYYVGYSMDFPELCEYVAWQKKHSGMEHLLFDGLRLRSEQEIAQLLREIYLAGTREISLTLYGEPAYHDRFAGRKGDFAYLMRLADLAVRQSIRVSISIMLTRENMDQMQELFAGLEKLTLSNISVILPHAKGRGEGISHLRLTAEDYEMLSPEVKAHFPRFRYRTEAEFLAQGTLPTAYARHLTLSLTPDNIDRLESMEPGDIIRELEKLDDEYYAALPPVEELAKLCGEPDNQQLFRFRDLILQWQCRFWSNHPIMVHNMNDERGCFSVRVYSE